MHHIIPQCSLRFRIRSLFGAGPVFARGCDDLDFAQTTTENEGFSLSKELTAVKTIALCGLNLCLFAVACLFVELCTSPRGDHKAKWVLHWNESVASKGVTVSKAPCALRDQATSQARKYPATLEATLLTVSDRCFACAGGGADTAANSLGIMMEAGRETAKLFRSGGGCAARATRQKKCIEVSIERSLDEPLEQKIEDIRGRFAYSSSPGTTLT